jgi:hypothetical protein
MPTVFYNKTMNPDGWWYGNMTYNSTAATTFIAGRVRHARVYNVRSYDCPASGCASIPETVVEVRDGVLRWSDPATWTTRPGGKPAAWDNVTIPEVCVGNV